MNKIRVIDLLNKIANGEDTPNQFMFRNLTFYKYDLSINDYIAFSLDDNNGKGFGNFINGYSLNDEIEIIEDEPKKIENIKLDSEECIEYYEDGIKKHLNTNKKDKMYVKVLNEVIDCINNMEK